MLLLKIFRKKINNRKMGCAEGHTVEGGKASNSGYPVCRFSHTLKSETQDKETQKKKGPIIEYNSLVSVDSNRLFLGKKDELQVFDIAKKSISTVSKEHIGRINYLIKLSNGKIISAGQDKTIKQWDPEKTKSIFSLPGHKSMIWCIGEVSGNRLISGSSDNSLKLWDLSGKKCLGDLFVGKDEISAAIQLKSEKLLFATGNKLIKFDLKNKKEEKNLEVPGGIWALHELKNGNVAAGFGNGDVAILEVNSELKIKTKFAKGHSRTVTMMIELDNGKIVSGSDGEKNLILWDPNDKDSKYIIEGHTENISALAFIEGNKFASISKDLTLKIWE